MTERFSPAAEFDAIARLAAGLLEAPIATMTVIGERTIRLGGCGVSWPVGDEEPFVRSVAGTGGAGGHALTVLDLASHGVIGADLLIADGVRGACVVPLGERGEALGVLAIYAPVVLELSHAARRRLLDLAELATQLLLARGDEAPASASVSAIEPPRPGLAERRVLELVKHASDRIAIADEEGRIVYANPSLARARNESPAELVGRSLGEFNPPELKQLPGFDRIRRTGSDPTLTQPFVRHVDLGGGRTSTWEIAGSQFTVDGSLYVGIVARDLSAASQRLAATMANVSIGIAHVSLDGQFLRFNEQFESLVGRSASELRAYQLALDVAPPPDQRGLSFIDALGLAGRVDLPAIRGHLATTDEPYELEYELVRLDGCKVWLDLSIALVRDPTSRPAYLVVVAREVTARRRVDVALRDLAETLSHSGPAMFGARVRLPGHDAGCALRADRQDARCIGAAARRVARRRAVRCAGVLAGRDTVRDRSALGRLLLPRADLRARDRRRGDPGPVAAHRGRSGRAHHAEHLAGTGRKPVMVLNVIVVDDSAMMRLVVRRALRMMNLPIGRIDEAGDGIEALLALRARPFDLALVDIHMPNMDGLALIDAIAGDVQLSHLPIVVISTEASKPRLDEIGVRGIRFVRKPFDPERLRDAVVGALGFSP